MSTKGNWSPPSVSGRLVTLGLVASWYSSNIGVLLLNKYLLSNYGFKYPIFLTMCHMTACSLLSYVAIAWLRVVPMQTVRSRLQFVKIAALSLVFCGSVVSGNVSLRYLPVSFNQAVGATTPFFTAVFAYIITVKREAWVTYATLSPVVAGVVIASGGEPSFQLFGFIMCISATAARALKSVLQGILLSSEGEKLNSMNLLLHMAPIAVVFLLPATLVMEKNVVLGNAKGAVAVVVSILIFKNPVTVTGMLGYAVTVIGVILYGEAKKLVAVALDLLKLEGVSFSFPITGGKAVGFHGNAGWYLDSIGFYLKQARSPSPSKAFVPFQSLAASMEGTASQGYDIVLAVRGRGQIFTAPSNINTRELAWPSQDYGGLDLKNKIAFDFPFEILTHITGYFGMTKLMGPTAVKPLAFHTTKRDYGPYGDKQGTFFSSSLVDGMIIGFHGRSGWYINSVGVHSLEGKVPSAYGPSSDSKRCNDKALSLLDYPSWSGKPVDSTREIAEEVTYGLLKEPAPTGPGPWGGDGGKPWDDGVYSGTKQAYITRGDAINSVRLNTIGVVSLFGLPDMEATERPRARSNLISGY
ncbi:UAA transporter family [Musa troglodytarum]|uniref:UAA transporter family n=1 Tax=Musa troglodytarum TaxID=320322 RepID=A0A9E7IGU7_9LILI|nr:UAA transporter family [Musa troglodytarum]